MRNMDTIYTDEKDERFLELVGELDRGYYERIEMNCQNMTLTMSLRIIM